MHEPARNRDDANLPALHIEQLRTVHPEGAEWNLIGYSMGGLLAYETARRLRERGERVGLVGLLDTRVTVEPSADPDFALRALLWRGLKLELDIDWLRALDPGTRAQVLVERANLKAGQTAFIQAGSGGVGTIAIQLAKHLGAKVVTTTGTSNVGWVKDLGADRVIDYRTEKFENLVSGVDVFLDTQEGKEADKALSVIKPGGKLIGISGPLDARFADDNDLGLLMKVVGFLMSFNLRRKAKRKGVTYDFVFMRAQGEQLGRITDLIDAGAIRPVVDRVFPFERTPEALAYVEGGRAKGKVVIKVK